jgi:hypothetical protein
VWWVISAGKSVDRASSPVAATGTGGSMKTGSRMRSGSTCVTAKSIHACRVALRMGHPQFVCHGLTELLRLKGSIRGIKKHWAHTSIGLVGEVRQTETGAWVVSARLAPKGVCPGCGTPSRQRHGWRRRWRTLMRAERLDRRNLSHMSRAAGGSPAERLSRRPGIRVSGARF